VPNLVEIMKKAAIEAVKASSPSDIVFGRVVGISPLRINIEQRLTLEASHLILTSLVQDFEVDMTVDHFTENDAFLNTSHSHPNAGSNSFNSMHKHAYKGRKKFLVHLGLTIGESVMLIQAQGGQKYIVLDRVRNV